MACRHDDAGAVVLLLAVGDRGNLEVGVARKHVAAAVALLVAGKEASAEEMLAVAVSLADGGHNDAAEVD